MRKTIEKREAEKTDLDDLIYGDERAISER